MLLLPLTLLTALLPAHARCSKLYHDELVGRAKEEAHRAEKKVRMIWQCLLPAHGGAFDCTCPRHSCSVWGGCSPLNNPPLDPPPARFAPPLTVQQARRAREDFMYMLKHMRDVKPETSWEEAAELCKGEPEWADVSGVLGPLLCTVSCAIEACGLLGCTGGRAVHRRVG